MYRGFCVTLGESFRVSVGDFIKNGRRLSGGNESYRQGYLMGLQRAFTLMVQAADIYEISLEELSLADLKDEDFLN